MAIVQVPAAAPLVGAAARAWADRYEAGERLRALVWPWAAWASLLRPARLWTEAFVLLSAWSQTAGWRRASRLAGAGARWTRRPLGRPGGAVHDDGRAGRRWRPAARQTFRVLVWAVVVCSVGAFAAAVAVPTWYATQGQRLLIVTSGSMSPFVEAGDVAVLQAIDDPSQLRVGQVVTFWSPGSKHMVPHRIVNLEMKPVLEKGDGGQMVPKLDATGQPIMRPYVFTKGDANEAPDPNATPLSLVSGVVVAALPGWGLLLGWVQSPLGKLVLLAPPLVLLAALELVDALAERRPRPVRRGLEVTDALAV